MRVRFMGHAFFILEGSKTIYIDPFMKGNPKLPDIPVPKPDIIMVTHGHGDHLGDTLELARNKPEVLVITNFEIHNWLRARGVNALGAYIGSKIKFDWGWVKLVPAWHGSSLPDGSYGGVALGFIINLDRKTIYHAGDTGLFYDMKLIGEHGIDLALLPIGGMYTMDIEDAVKAVELIKPAIVVPMHYNTFDRIKANPEEFKREASKVEGVRVTVLEPGESLEL